MRHITVYEITVYEDLIDYEKGPKETVDLISFVHRVTNVPLFMQPSQIPCIWSKVLQLKTIPYLYHEQQQPSQSQQQPNQNRSRRRRRLQNNNDKADIEILKTNTGKGLDEQSLSSPSSTTTTSLSRPYTYLQLDKVASTLTTMIEEYSYDSKLLSALMRYRSSILQRMSILKGNDSNPILVQNVHGTCIDATPNTKRESYLYSKLHSLDQGLK